LDREMASSFRSVIKSVLIGYIIAIIIFLIYGMLLRFTSVSESSMPIVTRVVSAATIFLSGILSARQTRSKGWITGGLAGFIYTALLLVFSMILLKEFQPDTNLLVDIAVGILVGTLGGILGVNL